MKKHFEPDIFRTGNTALAVSGNAEYEGTMLKLNETALQIFDLLAKGFSEDEITSAMAREYDADSAFISDCVEDCIRQFRQYGLIRSGEEEE